MSDEPARECEVCGQPVKRLFSPVAVHFKGSGFYTTDYARKSTLSAVSSKGDCAASESTASSGSGSGNGDAPKADSSTSSASESSKPAPAPAAPATKIA
jgi:predicted nucleic acid-binding Zn ribbon protein